MASKISNAIIKGDKLIIAELGKHLRYSKDDINTLIKASKKGIIAVETLVEEAISKVAKVKRSSKDGEDFVNGWDAKKELLIGMEQDLMLLSVNVQLVQRIKQGTLFV